MATGVIAIVGPTASGKSALGIRLAERFNGEIIAADSRTIYKEMNIGTAKPTAEEMAVVRHHCINLISPGESYSVHSFKIAAEMAITDIKSRGKVPFLVGGTGLYADAVLYDYDFGIQKVEDTLPDDLPELQAIARDAGYIVPDQIYQNPRHLKGFIRRGGEPGKRGSTDALILGMRVEQDVLYERIEQRVYTMLNAGFVQEVSRLVEKYGPDAPGFTAPGYRPFIDFLSSKISEQEAINLFIANDKALAKRQLTWFKRNKDIQWVGSAAEGEQLIRAKLSLV